MYLSEKFYWVEWKWVATLFMLFSCPNIRSFKSFDQLWQLVRLCNWLMDQGNWFHCWPQWAQDSFNAKENLLELLPLLCWTSISVCLHALSWSCLSVSATLPSVCWDGEHLSICFCHPIYDVYCVIALSTSEKPILTINYNTCIHLYTPLNTKNFKQALRVRISVQYDILLVVARNTAERVSPHAEHGALLIRAQLAVLAACRLYVSS